MADAAVAALSGVAAPTVDDARLAAEAVGADDRVGRVLVFGSVARGEAAGRSDIDLMVVVADSCDIDEMCGLSFFAGQAARGAVDWPVDVVLRRRSEFEHMARNVAASLEADVAGHAVLVYQGVCDSSEIDPAIVEGVPRDNVELAAEQAKSALRSIGGIEAEIDGISNQEAKIADGGEADEVRQLRYARILEASHMVLEQCFRAVASAVENKSLGKGHDLGAYLAEMGDSPEKDALAAAVSPLRNPSGRLMTWRLTSYTMALEQWQREMTAENASAHIAAAAECARTAAACIAQRAPSHSPAAQRATTLHSAAASLQARPRSPQDLEHGPAANAARADRPARRLLNLLRPPRTPRP